MSGKPPRSPEDAQKDLEEIKKCTRQVFGKIMGDISRSSATKQILFGATSGWATGFLTMKVGKAVAISVGGGIIILQIAHSQGYIKIDWDRFNRNVERIANQVEDQARETRWLDKVGNFAKSNSFFAAAFVGGFLIGIAT